MTMAAPFARFSSRPAAIAVLLVATATIAGALASQYVFGLVPCKLCLWQRWPYYVGVPLALATVLLPRDGQRRLGLGCLALLFLAGAGLGAYHAGAEWVLWSGPSDCGGGASGPASAADLLQTLNTIRVVSCTEAAWRFMDISLAGWNTLISLGVAVLAMWVASRRPGPEIRVLPSQPAFRVSEKSSSMAAQERASASAL